LRTSLFHHLNVSFRVFFYLFFLAILSAIKLCPVAFASARSICIRNVLKVYVPVQKRPQPALRLASLNNLDIKSWSGPLVKMGPIKQRMDEMGPIK
jgi:hypothetical protein